MVLNQSVFFTQLITLSSISDPNWRLSMKKRQLIEGYLTRSRRSGIHLPLFRSQWIRRYFVLSLTPSGPIVEEYHCDKKEALRKSYDLSKCEQVDSYLQLADTACGYPRFSLVSQWIFSLHLKIDGRTREIFFVAQSEREMNAWVTEMCRICGLARSMDQHADGVTIRIPASGGEEILSSFGSGRSSESLIDTPSEVTSDGNRRDHDHHQPRNPRYASTRTMKVKNGTHPRMAPAEKKISLRTRNASGEHIARASSSASGCSSMTSSHHTTEDETSSVHSSHSLNTGPPLPPKPIRNRFTHQSSTTSSGILYGSRSRGMNLSQTIPAPSCTLVELENESSGETIKMHTISTKASPPTHSYAIPHGYLILPSASGSKTSSVSSSIAIGPTQGPPVDRSKKPAKLRLEQEDRDDHRRNDTLTRTPRTPQYTRPKNRQMFEAPRSAGPITHTAHLDYFEPKLFEHLDRTVSDRGSTPSDFDYIKIDAAKTQAIKIAASMK